MSFFDLVDQHRLNVLYWKVTEMAQSLQEFGRLKKEIGKITSKTTFQLEYFRQIYTINLR